MTVDLGPYQVTTNCWQRSCGLRWAYVIHRPGWWPQTSHYRYHSEAAAQSAGERAVAAAWERPDCDR